MNMSDLLLYAETRGVYTAEEAEAMNAISIDEAEMTRIFLIIVVVMGALPIIWGTIHLIGRLLSKEYLGVIVDFEPLRTGDFFPRPIFEYYVDDVPHRAKAPDRPTKTKNIGDMGQIHIFKEKMYTFPFAIGLIVTGAGTIAFFSFILLVVFV